MDQLPEAVSYTFAISDAEGHFLDRKLLFLWRDRQPPSMGKVEVVSCKAR